MNKNGSYPKKPLVRHLGQIEEVEMPSLTMAFWVVTRNNQNAHDLSNTAHAVAMAPKNLDIKALSEAVGILVKRHRILGAEYEERNGKLYARFTSSGSPEVEALIYSPTEGKRRSNFYKFVYDTVYDPFKINDSGYCSKLFRVFTITNEYGRDVLGFVVHHGICDGISVSRLVSELSELYSSLVRGQTPSRDSARPDFVDHVVSLRDWLASSPGHNALQFWKDKTEGVGRFNLPRDCYASPDTRAKISDLWFEFPPLLLEKVVGLSRTLRIDVSSIIITAQYLATMKSCGVRDGLMRFTHYGREQLQFLHSIGLFVGSLPIQIRADENHNAVELLMAVSAEVRGFLSATALPGDLAIPLTQGCASFNYMGLPTPVQGEGLFDERLFLRLPELAPDALIMPEGLGVELNVFPYGKRLMGFVLYDPNYNSTGMIRNYIGEILLILLGLTDEPDRKIESVLENCNNSISRECMQRFIKPSFAEDDVVLNLEDTA